MVQLALRALEDRNQSIYIEEVKCFPTRYGNPDYMSTVARTPQPLLITELYMVPLFLYFLMLSSVKLEIRIVALLS